MPVCTYDNPVTMARECWHDGRLLCKYDAALLMSKEAIPAARFFFGANVGPWHMGQIVGSAEAMTAEGRPGSPPSPSSS